MSKPVKLDLLNARIVHQHPADNFVFDSSEDSRLYKSIRIHDEHRQSSSFLSKQTKIAPVEFLGASGSMKVPAVDNKGNRCDVDNILKHGPRTVILENKPKRFADVSGNPIAETFFHGHKERIQGDTMNRILDNTHDVPAVTLYGNIVAGKLPGGTWSKNKLVSNFQRIGSDLGPGDYDVTYPNEKQTSVKFSTVPKKSMIEDQSEHGDYHGEILQEYSSGISFGKAPRFDKNCPEYRQEVFIKTSGMKLGHDYDRPIVERGKVPIKLDFKGDRISRPNREYITGNIDVVPDCGNKMSLETSANVTKKEYAMVFKSKAQVGMSIPKTTSLDHVGPGSYRGKEVPSCAVRESHREHYFFKRDRRFSVRQALVDSHVKIKPFSETHNRGISFAKDGKSAGNVHLQEWTRTKIIKIYPKLGRKKYGHDAVAAIHAPLASTDVHSRPGTSVGENSSKSSLW